MTHYIIDFVNDATDTGINEYLRSCGATVIKTFSAFEKVVLVECESEPPANAIVEYIKDDNDHTNHIKLLTTIPIQHPALSSEGSKTVVLSEQKDWWKVYSGSGVDLDAESFELPLSGAGAIVYLVDSGIKADHIEFAEADIENLYSFNEDFVDRKGHGTALASLIVGKTCGITNAKLKVVKLFDTTAPTKLSDFLGAMDAIYTDFIAVNAYGIMNCSWEIARNEYVEAKMQKLFLAGIQIVVAAGNDGSDIGDVTPAAMTESIVVGSYNAMLEPSDFSDYTGTSAISVTAGSTNGGRLSGWAPGENIYTATLDGGYAYSAGTSVAAAIHSAIVAYNVTLPTYQFDDTINSIWNDATRNNVSFMAKRGLLVLDDPKYENSPNLVSLLITDLIDPYKNRAPGPLLFAAIFAGAPFRITLFNPLNTSSVTLNDPLPAGIGINNYGIMSGYVDSVEGDMEEHHFSVSVTELDGNTTLADLNIKILKILPQHTVSYNVNPIIPYDLNVNNCESPSVFCEGNESVCETYSCIGVLQCLCQAKVCACNN
jgi:hypothetical protein